MADNQKTTGITQTLLLVLVFAHTWKPFETKQILGMKSKMDVYRKCIFKYSKSFRCHIILKLNSKM